MTYVAAEGPSKGFSWVLWKAKRPRKEAPRQAPEWEGQSLIYMVTMKIRMLIVIIVGTSQGNHFLGSGGGGRGWRGFSLRRWVWILIVASGAGEGAIGVLPIGTTIKE